MEYQAFAVFGGDGDDLTFSHTVLIATDMGNALYGRMACRENNIDPNLVASALAVIPPAHIYPEYAEDFTKAPVALNVNTFFIKRPSYICYGEENEQGNIAKLLLEEAKVYERLTKEPHPNITKYHGCVVRDGRIVGLALKRYHRTLLERMRNSEGQLNGIICLKYMEGIKAGVDHIHSLGLAHNDLNPSNIMFAKGDDTPVIIDFDACRPENAALAKGGTPGWSEGTLEKSTRDNDSRMLALIQRYLDLIMIGVPIESLNDIAWQKHYGV